MLIFLAFSTVCSLSRAFQTVFQEAKIPVSDNKCKRLHLLVRARAISVQRSSNVAP
jgi:hypothetical protein